jgi:hypothetical protein
LQPCHKRELRHTADPQGPRQLLPALVQTTMPFGKYKGELLCHLPAFYLEGTSKNPSDEAFRFFNDEFTDCK